MKYSKIMVAITGVGAAFAMALSMPALAGNLNHSLDGNLSHNNNDNSNQNNDNSQHQNLTAVLTSIGLHDVGNSDSSTHVSVGNVAVSSTNANTTLRGTVNGDGEGFGGHTGMGGPANSDIAQSTPATALLLASAHAHAGIGGFGGLSSHGGSSGDFTVANSIKNGANGAGIMNVSQNLGASSLIQQGVTVQANMSFNH